MKYPMKLMAAVALAGAMVSGHAMAGEIQVKQEKKNFSVKKLSAKVGDTIVFVNADSFTHNLYSKKVAKFDSGVMKPSDVYKLKVDEAGKFTVRCAIHPKMKLRVTAE